MANLTKDQRLIKENQDKDPYELLQLGLSQSKYNELVAAMTSKPKKAEEKKSHTEPNPEEKKTLAPQRVTVIRATPQTRQYNQPESGAMAWYLDPQGKGTHMSRTAAERLSRKTPGSKVV